MARTKICVNAVLDADEKLSASLYIVKDTRNSVSYLANSIDGRIKGRKNIAGRLSNVCGQLSDVESRLNAMSNFTQTSVNRYNSTECSVVQWALEVTNIVTATRWYGSAGIFRTVADSLGRNASQFNDISAGKSGAYATLHNGGSYSSNSRAFGEGAGGGCFRGTRGDTYAHATIPIDRDKEKSLNGAGGGGGGGGAFGNSRDDAGTQATQLNGKDNIFGEWVGSTINDAQEFLSSTVFGSIATAVMGAVGAAQTGAAKAVDYIGMLASQEGNKIEGSVLEGSANLTKGSTKYGDYSVDATGKVLNGSVKLKTKASWDLEDKDFGIIAGIEAEGSVAKGSLEAALGMVKSELEGSVLTGAASGSVGLSLFKNGKLSPSLEAKVKAEAKVAEGSIKNTLGVENLNYYNEAKGSILGAEASANAGAGMITRKDKDGKEHQEFGVSAKAGAKAYLAEGSISGGFNIFGIDIGITVGGMAGGVGAEAGGAWTVGGMSGKVGLGLGLGAEVGVDIDWSGFVGVEEIGKIVDTVSEGVGEVAEFVSDGVDVVVDTVENGIEMASNFINDVGDFWGNAWNSIF